MPFYYANVVWSLISLLVLTWYTNSELAYGYQTNKGILLTYALEIGYLCLSVIAWRTITNTSYDDFCSSDTKYKYTEENFTELAVDMIILDYMRCIKLISIIAFALLCSPVLLVCWCVNKPTPPVDVKNHLSTVTIE